MEILGNFQQKVLQNQFLGNFPKIFSRVPQEYLEIFSANSWVNSLTRTCYSYSEEFLVTHSKEPGHSKEFPVTNSREFLVTNSAEKLEKMSTKLVKFLGISSEKFFWTNSWELFPRFSPEFLRNILKYSQHIPE